MHLISFNVFRTLGIPDVTVLKPDQMFSQKKLIEQADWVLFPEYWQLNPLLFACNSRIFPSVASYRIGHDKIEMTRTLMLMAGQHLPETHIAANTETEAERLWEMLPTPFVAKLPKSSQGDGVWLIEDRRDWQKYCTHSPVLYIQEYLPITRDLRVIVIGNEVVAAYWRQGAGFHNNLSRGAIIIEDDIPRQCIDLVLTLSQQLSINHAGWDLAVFDGHIYILEFNRLFGNRGIPGGGKTITNAIINYLASVDEPEWPKPTVPAKKLPLAM